MLVAHHDRRRGDLAAAPVPREAQRPPPARPGGLLRRVRRVRRDEVLGAGLVARRILSFVKEGDRVEAGERVGLIRFGSRVDVYLPAGTGSQVLLGQRTIAGETVLGEIGVDPNRRGSSQ